MKIFSGPSIGGWMCLLTVAKGTPFQADASVTAQLNIIHMLDKRRYRPSGFQVSGNATHQELRLVTHSLGWRHLPY